MGQVLRWWTVRYIYGTYRMVMALTMSHLPAPLSDNSIHLISNIWIRWYYPDFYRMQAFVMAQEIILRSVTKQAGLDSRPFIVGSVVQGVALGQVSLRGLTFAHWAFFHTTCLLIPHQYHKFLATESKSNIRILSYSLCVL
jgi:hypothetical protein